MDQVTLAALDANNHVFTPTRDDHTQYARVDGTRAFTGGIIAPSEAANLTGTTGRYVGATNGSPTGGPYNTGDFANDPTSGCLWLCTAGGSPGSWEAVGFGGSGAVVQTHLFGSQAGNFGTTNSTAWVSETSGLSTPFNITKRFAGTNILIEVQHSAYVSGAGGVIYAGMMLDGGTIQQIAAYYFNTLSDHRSYAGRYLWTGISAGSHGFTPTVKVANSGTNWTTDNNDTASWLISEVW